MNLMKKLEILADGAKYDAACTSSGADRKGMGGLGSALPAGCCHSFSADGRCISLLKVLMSNDCIYDCKYCVNRRSEDKPRATFTPQELAEHTIQYYRRNYIEGLFLSSGVIKNPDYTTEQMIEVLQQLRYKHNFWGYIHAKTIPGASPGLIYKLGLLADRISVNIELPSEASLNRLAPNKTKKSGIQNNSKELTVYKHAPKFASAGQSTQMIIGASEESDYQILKLSEGLYDKYSLKRVFYSAYIPAVEDSLLPTIDTKPPLLREHRLYQADWLIRKYNFNADEILTEQTPNFNPFLDPKCNWAVHNLHLFPVDINTASYNDLLRVPGIGPVSAKRITVARKSGKLGNSELARIGVVLKRARYFILTKDSPMGIKLNREVTVRSLVDPSVYSFGAEQLSFFDSSINKNASDEVVRSVVGEAVLSLASGI